MARQIALYGALLALGTLALQALDWLRLARAEPLAVYLFLLAALFLAIGVAVGRQLFAAPPPAFDGNPKAQAALGISARELEVLQALAAGKTNKEIARALAVSPHTIKTHLANLYAKLEAKRRTDAIARARLLGLLP